MHSNALTALVVVFVASLVTSAAPAGNTCSSLLDAALKPGAPLAAVGHLIHSITVMDLQQFEPTANGKNYVPVINYDLTSSHPILPHATDRRGSGDFFDYSMKILDDILDTMDKKNWDVSHYTVLERIVHAFHMKEMWAKAKARYDEVKSTSPSDALCACIMDVENNGIMNTLRYTAMAIREPELVYGEDMYNKEVSNLSYREYGWNKLVFNKKFVQSAQDDERLPQLLDAADAMQPLVNAAVWQKWKKGIEMSPDGDYNSALFLYCALNKPTTN